MISSCSGKLINQVQKLREENHPKAKSEKINSLPAQMASNFMALLAGGGNISEKREETTKRNLDHKLL
jgi:hypothetical protein